MKIVLALLAATLLAGCASAPALDHQLELIRARCISAGRVWVETSDRAWCTRMPEQEPEAPAPDEKT